MTRSHGAVILGGPVPTDSGACIFSVRVGEQLVQISVSPLGLSFEQEGSVAGLARDQVQLYLRSNGPTMTEAYRDAARLRRASGNPPPAGNTRSPRATLDGAPIQKSSCTLFSTQTERGEIRVICFKDGAILDDCDNWAVVRPVDRDAAMTCVIDWIIENPQLAGAVGVDPNLIEDLWR